MYTVPTDYMCADCDITTIDVARVSVAQVEFIIIIYNFKICIDVYSIPRLI
jgi:hypothetical protein